MTTTRGRGIAPPPPPGSSGGASSPASVSSNANSGSPMTKRLGLIRGRSDGTGNGGGVNMIGSSSSAVSLNNYGGGSGDAGVGDASHNMMAAATTSAGSLGAWGGASNRQVVQSTNFNEILLEEERKQSRDNDSPDERLKSLRSRLGSNEESLGDSLRLLLQQTSNNNDGPTSAYQGLDDDSVGDGRTSCPHPNSLVDHREGGRIDEAVPTNMSNNAVVDDPSDIFRRKGYSPIIGTPTRGGVPRKGLLDWNNNRPRTASNNEIIIPEGGGGEEEDYGDSLSGSVWIPNYIRPSLSCPTSVFESPLFPSPQSSPVRLGGGMGGRCSNNILQHNNSFGGYHHNLHGQSQVVGRKGGSNSATNNLPPKTMMLNQPYRLEKIQSINASEIRQRSSDEDGGANNDNEDGSSDEDELHILVDNNGVANNHRMDNSNSLDVSAIECDSSSGDDNSPFRRDNSANDIEMNTIRRSLEGGGDGLSSSAAGGEGGDLTTPVGYEARRKLSDTFDMLAVVGSPPRQQLCQVDAGDASALSSTVTKPSPTSVSGLDGETMSGTLSSESVVKSALQLENGLNVASISMPHFHLHEALRGTLSQGLIDRVSFYSIVRDINKEALDAVMTDPRGSVYNDGSVHGGNDDVMKSSVKASCLPRELSLVDGKLVAGRNRVTAEDGKIHVHPNPKEERNSVLVIACLSDEKNPNEASDMNECTENDYATSAPNNNPSASCSPLLGAALLDEEWWLMAAIASRTPEEVIMNQSTKLLPTFHEAIGEKDVVLETIAGGTSRTQLWKPGRSWWEAKSGKNPWVEPVVHNNRWRYLWPLIHYHKFIAKCIKKLKRNGIDVKTSTSNVSFFLRQEVCNVSDHLAFMSKYDSEEWTSALSHFETWTDQDPNVEETLRILVASQKLAGLSETNDIQSSLLRSQIDDKILKAMQVAKDEAGRDAYDYKDAPTQKLGKKRGEETSTTAVGDSSMSSSDQQQYLTQVSGISINSSMNRSTAWMDESHLRAAIESRKRSTRDNPYPHHDAFGHQYSSYPAYCVPPGFDPAYGPPPGYGYPPQQYEGYGQYPPPTQPPMGYYNDQYGHPHQYYNGYYHPANGSFHEGMILNNSMISHDPYMHHTAAHTPDRGPGQYPPASPYWGHLNISQLPGIAPSPHATPAKPPRGSHVNRSFRKRQNQQGTTGYIVDGKAKGLIMYSNQTNSPASRFVMSPQESSSNNSYYTNVAQHSTMLNHSAFQEESFVLPTIEDYSLESPANKSGGHLTLHTSNTSMDLMPPSVKKLYTQSSRRQDVKLSEVSENT